MVRNNSYHGHKNEEKRQRNKERRKKLLMAEDFLSNIRERTREMIRFCNVDHVDIDMLLPVNDTNGDKVNTYQNILLHLEIIYQYIENTSRENQRLHDENDLFKVIQNRNNELENVVEKIQDDYTFLNNKFEVTKKNLRKKNEKLEQMRKQCEITGNLFKENINLKEENNNLKLSIQDIEDDYEQEKASLEEVIRISDENLYLNNKIDILHDENKRLKDDVKIFQSNIFKTNQLTSKNKSLENLVQKMKHTIKQKSKELVNKNNELSTLKETKLPPKRCQCEIQKELNEQYILKCNIKSFTEVKSFKNVLSNPFVTSLREVYNKQEDIDNFIYNMLEKENNPPSNVFRKEDACVDRK